MSKLMQAEDVENVVQRVLSEDVLTISQARDELHEITGFRPHKSCVVRWISRGVGGVKLEGIRLGGQFFTSRQSLTRFIVARSAKD
jgi:hypothetical protein